MSGPRGSSVGLAVGVEHLRLGLTWRGTHQCDARLVTLLQTGMFCALLLYQLFVAGQLLWSTSLGTAGRLLGALNFPPVELLLYA